MKFSQRSYKKELLDGDNIDISDLYQNLRELDFINSHLGGHAVTVKGLAALITDKNKAYRILDIGSGGGDTLRYIAKWGRKNHYQFILTGVDLKQDCINFSTKESKEYPEISFVKSDYRDKLNQDFDIIISSLFCHHLDDNQLVDLLKWMNENAKYGFIINDLHRNRVAYYSISWLTKIFSKSSLVKNDAKLSVLRGFRKKEMKQFVQQSNVSSFKLTWQWAFRWLLIVKTN